MPAHQQSNIVYVERPNDRKNEFDNTFENLLEIKLNLKKIFPDVNKKSTQTAPILDSAVGKHLLDNITKFARKISTLTDFQF